MQLITLTAKLAAWPTLCLINSHLNLVFADSHQCMRAIEGIQYNYETPHPLSDITCMYISQAYSTYWFLVSVVL